MGSRDIVLPGSNPAILHSRGVRWRRRDRERRRPGECIQLEVPSDFAGKYFALSGGFAIARGETAAILENKRGVMMALETFETGLQFNIAATGLKIVMAGQHGCKAK